MFHVCQSAVISNYSKTLLLSGFCFFYRFVACGLIKTSVKIVIFVTTNELLHEQPTFEWCGQKTRGSYCPQYVPAEILKCGNKSQVSCLHAESGRPRPKLIRKIKGERCLGHSVRGAFYLLYKPKIFLSVCRVITRHLDDKDHDRVY